MNKSFRIPERIHKRQSNNGFSIVELLVVIVVIGALAAILIYAYSEIIPKAKSASLKSDLSEASTFIKAFEIRNGNYPTTISTNCTTNPDSTTNKCIKFSSGNTIVGYAADNLSSTKTFLLILTNGSIVYKITDNMAPTLLANVTQPGVTPGATVELHAAKANGGAGPGINSPMTAIWDDTSENSRDALLSNFSGSPWIGTGTAVNPYALAFTGGDDYLYNTSTPMNKSSYTLEVWMRQTVRSPAYSRWLMNHSNGGLSDWNGDGRMYALLWGTGGPGYALVDTSADLADGALHHIVMTTGTTELKLYVDNVHIGTSSLVNFVPNDPATTIAFASSGWVGNISVARVYGWPLSATQISDNFTAGADW